MQGLACSAPELPPETQHVELDQDHEQNTLPDVEPVEDPLSAGRGIALGMLLAVSCWVLIGFAVYWLLRKLGI
ncbi:MAG TPA: hypothetical protein VGH36_14505 [Acetobacteraceae bacterium]|jgi:hypothetical protein